MCAQLVKSAYRTELEPPMDGYENQVGYYDHITDNVEALLGVDSKFHMNGVDDNVCSIFSIFNDSLPKLPIRIAPTTCHILAFKM